jgi:hypothetical protein
MDVDPVVRSGGLQAIAGIGLRPWASWLLARTAELDAIDPPTQTTRTMAAELAWLVSACQWEPADAAEVVQLRLWATAYHRAQEARPVPQGDPPGPATPDASSPPTVASTPTAPVPRRGEGPWLDERVAAVLGEPVLEVRFVPAKPSEEPDTGT